MHSICSLSMLDAIGASGSGACTFSVHSLHLQSFICSVPFRTRFGGNNLDDIVCEMYVALLKEFVLYFVIYNGVHIKN